MQNQEDEKEDEIYRLLELFKKVLIDFMEITYDNQ